MRLTPEHSWFNPSRFTLRFGVFGSVLVLPFIEFLVEQRYALWQVESIACLLLFIVATAIPAGVTARMGVFLFILVCGLSVIQVTVLQLLFVPLRTTPPLYILGAGLFALGWLAYLLREKFGLIVLVLFSASFVSGTIEVVVSPQDLSISTRESPEVYPQRHAEPDRRPAVFLYLILDEYMGPTGFPREIEPSQTAAASIVETLAVRKFKVFENAYSNYDATANSLPSLLRLDLLDRPVSSGQEGSEQPSEAFLGHQADPTFEVRTYQSNLFDLNEWFGETEKVVRYDHTAVGVVQGLSLTGWERFQLLIGSYLARTPPAIMVTKNIVPAVLKPAFICWCPANSLRVLDLLQQDILTARAPSLFVAHLLVPHSASVYKADGSVWPLSTLITLTDIDVKPAGDEIYVLQHTAYANQVQYLNARLARFFDALEAGGALDSATVVIHGDHGRRLLGRGNAGSDFRSLLESYSALLAVRRPGAAKGEVDRRKGSVLTFLKEEFGVEVPIEERERLDSVYFDRGDGTFASRPFRKLWEQETAKGTLDR